MKLNLYKVTSKVKVKSTVNIVTLALSATETGLITAAHPHFVKRLPKG